jgi:hypothetical protein
MGKAFERVALVDNTVHIGAVVQNVIMLGTEHLYAVHKTGRVKRMGKSGGREGAPGAMW